MSFIFVAKRDFGQFCPLSALAKSDKILQMRPACDDIGILLEEQENDRIHEVNRCMLPIKKAFG